MNKKILFLVNGLGLGNSIRCFSIIQRLRKFKTEINLVCSGNSAWFFKDKINTENFFEIDQIQYGKKGNNLSIYNTLLLTKKNLRIIKENVKKISNIINNLNLSVSKAEKDIGMYKSSLVKFKQAKEILEESIKK